MKWISVNDKLPKYLESDSFCSREGVLVLIETTDCPSPLISIGQCDDIGKWDIMDGNNLGYYSDTGCWEFENYTITHWMPLPNQPERSKREDFDCCTRLEILSRWMETMEGFDHPDTDFTRVLLQESKMRCSEH